MKHLIIVISTVVLLTGCAVTKKDVELPKEGTGTDEMKRARVPVNRLNSTAEALNGSVENIP